MPVPAITPLTDLPSITDPANFDARADNLITVQFPRLVSEINAAGVGMDAAVIAAQAAASVAINGSSASSVLLGSGSKSFTVLAGHSWSIGTWLMIASRANPGTHWIIGQVTAYSGTSLTVSVHSFGGSGSRNDWDISLTAKPPDIPVATTSSNGLMSAADKVKLNDVASGATANQADTHLLNRANHTGNQAISTIAGLDTALNGKLSNNGGSFTGGYNGGTPAGLTGTSLAPALSGGLTRTYTNSAAFSLSAASLVAGSYEIDITMTNAAGAGAMTPSGFDYVDPDGLALLSPIVVGAVFILHIKVRGSRKTLYPYKNS